MPNHCLRFTLPLLFLTLLSLNGCSNKGTSNNTADSDADANVKAGVKPVPDDQLAVIETDYGKIVLELYPNIAPKMVERFKKLIQEGFYNGTTFHRVNSEAGLIQGGDPLSKDDNPLNDGTGDSPYPNVPAEFSDVPFERGSLGAARRGARPAFGDQAAITEAQARDTANCQFFITLQRSPDFDEDYTLFGAVISGMNNVEIIAGAPVAEGERPADKILIRSITLQPRAQFGTTGP